MKVVNIVFYSTVFLSFVAWLVLLAGMRLGCLRDHSCPSLVVACCHAPEYCYKVHLQLLILAHGHSIRN